MNEFTWVKIEIRRHLQQPDAADFSSTINSSCKQKKNTKSIYRGKYKIQYLQQCHHNFQVSDFNNVALHYM